MNMTANFRHSAIFQALPNWGKQNQLMLLSSLNMYLVLNILT